MSTQQHSISNTVSFASTVPNVNPNHSSTLSSPPKLSLLNHGGNSDNGGDDLGNSLEFSSSPPPPSSSSLLSSSLHLIPKKTSTSKLSILQEAAAEVKMEDLKESSQKLVFVADDLAHDIGLQSPLSSKDKKNSVTFDETIPSIGTFNPIQEAIDDIQALMKAMNIPEKSESPKKPEPELLLLEPEPVQTLITMEYPDDRLGKSSKSMKIEHPFDQSWKDRYLDKRSKLLDRSGSNSPNQHYRHPNIITSVSSQSLTLRSSYENGIAYKPAIQNILSRQKEMLFLRMKKVSLLDTKKKRRHSLVSSSSSSNTSIHSYSDPLRKSLEISAKDIERSVKQITATVSYVSRGVAPGKNDSLTKSSKISKEDKLSTYSTYDDATNCTFQPKIHVYRNSESKSSDDNSNQVKFYDRQDAIEKSRRERQNDAIGMKEYDTLLNKKYCPSCGARQSYDEYKEKRKKCQICNVEFRSKLAWNTVANKFLSSEELFLQKVIEKKKLLEYELEEERRMMKIYKFDKTSGKIKEFLEYCPSYRKDNIWTKEVQDEFFERLKEFHSLKELKLKKLSDFVSTKYYPFKPTIGTNNKMTADSKSDSKVDDRDNEDNDEDIPSFEAFLQRYYDDLRIRHANVRKIPYVSSSRSVSAGRSYMSSYSSSSSLNLSRSITSAASAPIRPSSNNNNSNSRSKNSFTRRSYEI